MSLIETNLGASLPAKRQRIIRTDRLSVFLIFGGAVVFHLAVIFNLLPFA